jgi:thioredoxin reductase (NADPH)
MPVVYPTGWPPQLRFRDNAGAGNAAGQAAVYLADRVEKVSMIVRGPSLGASMSRYLVERIAATQNIEVMYNTSVSALDGSDGILQEIRCGSHLSGDERTCSIRHLFLFIGADPNTD